jgi:VanZ family protein
LDLWTRVVFVGYAVFLATMTHWPNLKVESGLPRTDLWAHAGAFFVWTMLLLATGWLGARLSWKNLARGLPIGVAISGLDELTQGIPGLGRFVSWDDFGANVLGVGLAGVVWGVLIARAARG